MMSEAVANLRTYLRPGEQEEMRNIVSLTPVDHLNPYWIPLPCSDVSLSQMSGWLLANRISSLYGSGMSYTPWTLQFYTYPGFSQYREIQLCRIVHDGCLFDTLS